uniref:Sushi domain-containing protein n=1 Tax=Bos indicus x Bos taurus TaxID=30522 RepID=A0A4W2HGH3_BOBOX
MNILEFNPVCLEIFCKPPVILNGQAVLPKATYKRGDTVCTKSGWTPAPACIETICDPPHIPNGVYRPELSKYRVQDKITYDCKKGFIPEIRGTDATCTRDGWVPSPRCTRKPCNYPVIKHGRLYNSYSGYFPADVNQQFFYYCDQYFVSPSQRSWDYLTCTTEGWSPEEPCLRQCIFNYLENGHTPHREEKYLQGETVRVHCYEGYSLQNDQNTMTCTESGWSPPPRCIRVKTCSKYNITIENGFLSESTSMYPLNKQTEYKCKSGYVTADGKTSGLITCLQNGWSSQPVCISKYLSTSYFVFQSPIMKRTTFWGISSRRSCRSSENCSTSTSSHHYFLDSQGKCGPPPPIDNGDITSLLQSVYPPGMSVEYQCQACYELQGNRNLVCQNGEWSEPPKCLEACVISEETMRKHHIQLRWKPDTKLYFKTEDNIEFMCQHGYHPVTPQHTFRTTCLEGKVVYPSCGKNID